MSLQKEYESYLAHYGVPGMKWGVRKEQASTYKDSQVKRDISMYGKSGARKINKYMLKGDTYQTARHKMGHKRYKQASVRKAVGGILNVIGGLGVWGYNIGRLMDLTGKSPNPTYSAKTGKKIDIAKTAGLVGSILSNIGGYALYKSASKDKQKYSEYR